MIRTGEPNDYAAEILFYLAQASDPRLPKIDHVFVLGEVRIKLGAGGAWTNVTLDRLLQRGRGWYAIRLTAGQRAAAAEVAYEAVCADAQPDRGTEVVGALSGDIAAGAGGVIPFYLPNENDPIYGAPVAGHVFVLGQVELALPDNAFGNVATADIVEYGGGMYGVLVSATQTAKRGKAIVVANVPGAQRFSGYRTILGEAALAPPVPPPMPPAAEPGSDAATVVAGDLALVWSNTTGAADLSLLTDLGQNPTDLATDRGLVTAVVLSLFADRRAEPDDTPPSGDPTDRRGWWADQFAAVEGDRIGSRLWLLDRSTLSNETLLRAKEYALEALAWMIEDRVVSGVDVAVERLGRDALLFVIKLQRPGRDPVTFRFAHTWNNLQEVA